MEQLTHDELLSVLEIATRALTSDDFGDLKSIITSLGDVLGFHKAVLCALRLTDGRPMLTHCVNHSFGAKWASLYMRHRFDRMDPILSFSRTTTGAFEWSDAFRMEGANAKPFRDAANDFGMSEGVAYAGVSSPESAVRTVLSVSFRAREANPVRTARARRILSGVGPHLHEAYVRILPEPSGSGVSQALSPREIEVLEWAQQGKTYWEIGRILGISQRTVKYHSAQIKLKLDVTSVPHAVAKAIRTGMIT